MFLKQHCLTLSYVASKNGKRWGETEGKKKQKQNPNSITSQSLLSHSRGLFPNTAVGDMTLSTAAFSRHWPNSQSLRYCEALSLTVIPLACQRYVVEKKSIIFKLKASNTFTLFWNFFPGGWLNYYLPFPVLFFFFKKKVLFSQLRISSLIFMKYWVLLPW